MLSQAYKVTYMYTWHTGRVGRVCMSRLTVHGQNLSASVMQAKSDQSVTIVVCSSRGRFCIVVCIVSEKQLCRVHAYISYSSYLHCVLRARGGFCLGDLIDALPSSLTFAALEHTFQAYTVT